MREKNFNLSEAEFNALILDLKSGNETLFKQIFLKQFEPSLRHLQSKYQLPREKAYDISMDTMLYYRKLLISDKLHYGNLRFIFNKIASQIYLKQIEKNKRVESVDNFSLHEIQPKENNSEILETLEVSWKKLGADCKIILKHFYYDGLKLYQIAELMSKKPEAVRKQKTRCVNKLRSYISQYSAIKTSYE